MKLSQFIPNLKELGEGNAKPFPYVPKFVKSTRFPWDIYSLSFKDDQNDIVKLDFGGDDHSDAWFIDPRKILYTPIKMYNMGFSVNEVEVNDYKDDNAKAKRTDINYYTRLIATIKDIYFDFIKQHNPNGIWAGKYNSGKQNNQKETRYEMYARMFRNNPYPGYKYFNIENNMASGLVKNEYFDDIKLKIK